MDLIIGCWTNKYATFSGRARRKEYWLFWLSNIIGHIIFGGIVINFNGNIIDVPGTGIVYRIYILAAFVPALAVSARRLHDTNHSGWWEFIVLVPLIGAIYFFIVTCLKGTEGENRFGANPLAVQQDIKLETTQERSTYVERPIE